MLYKIAHLLRDNFSFLWNLLEWINSIVFKLRYSSELSALGHILEINSSAKYVFREAKVIDASKLANFFSVQPKEDYTFFKPHDFDEASLKKLLNRTSFLMFLVEEDNCIVGYFFLRSFCHGEAYLGKMVDHMHQGKGIGKMMCKTAMDIATTLGIRMFESINKNNIASIRSSSVLKQVVVKELKDGDVLIEDLPLE